VICASSKFFKAACSERWIERKTKKVSLPEVEPEVFQSYVAWLYSGHHHMEASKDDPVDLKDVALGKAVELYLLGDVLDDIRFRNKMMEIQTCQQDLNRLPNVPTMNKLWRRTTHTSPLRKMYTEMIIMRFLAENVGSYSPELARDILVASLKQIETSTVKPFTSKLATFLEPVPEDG
jgi:hypothetical protein